jgi:hypothetical protein
MIVTGSDAVTTTVSAVCVSEGTADPTAPCVGEGANSGTACGGNAVSVNANAVLTDSTAAVAPLGAGFNATFNAIPAKTIPQHNASPPTAMPATSTELDTPRRIILYPFIPPIMIGCLTTIRLSAPHPLTRLTPR